VLREIGSCFKEPGEFVLLFFEDKDCLGDVFIGDSLLPNYNFDRIS